MGIEITDVKITVQDPKKVDYNELSDDQFYNYKLIQPLTLLSKTTALAHLVAEETKRIEEIEKGLEPYQTKSEPSSISIQFRNIDTTKLSSLQFSLLLMQFTYVESLCNIIAECAIRNNLSTQKLNFLEQEYLQEVESKFRKGEIKTNTSFVPTEDKAKEYLRLYAKSYNETYNLDTSTSYWKGFINAKKIRNEITHPKNGVTSSIDIIHLFEMSRFIYLFTEESYKLFNKYTSTKHYRMIESWSFGMLDHLFRIQKNKKCTITTEVSKHNKIKKESGR